MLAVLLVQFFNISNHTCVDIQIFLFKALFSKQAGQSSLLNFKALLEFKRGQDGGYRDAYKCIF
jgi:hypothetical protein